MSDNNDGTGIVQAREMAEQTLQSERRNAQTTQTLFLLAKEINSFSIKLK